MTHALTLTFAGGPGAPAVAKFAAAEPGKAARLTGPAFPLGVASNPSSDGARYLFTAGPRNTEDLVDVVDEHNASAVVGRLAVPFAIDGETVLGDARLFDTSAARDLAVLVAEGVKTGFSVGAAFDSYTEAEDGVRVVSEWDALHLGVVRSPAFTQSRGLSLAASAQIKETHRMDPAAPTVTPQVVELPTVAELAAQVTAYQAEHHAAPTHPLAAYPNASAFFAAFQEAGEEDRQRMAAAFALGSQVTADNPGVMLPTWRTALVANLDKRRPAVQAFGGSIGLPDSGMTSSWPYFDGNLDAMVAEQAAQLAQLTGVKISIKQGTANIKTAGVASEISYQLLMRSSPAYMAMHNSITDAAWYRFTEAVFETAILAASTELGGAGVSLPAIAAGAKPTAFNGKIFEASLAVEDATGAPAEFVLCSTSIFKELGAADLPNPENGNGGGTPNATGTSSASRLRVNVNGLEHIRAPFLTAGTVIVSNSTAAKFPESGAMTATQDQVTKLGQEVATWGMYVPAEVYVPAGIVRLDRTA